MLKIAKMLRNRKGFTLVELMVVVVIIGILSAIAVPMFNNSRDSAAQAAHDANVRILKGAAAQYLSTNPATPDESWDGGESQAWSNFIESWPDNPTASGDYTVTFADGGYTVAPDAGDYD